jgi:hypothetical protein
MKGARVNTNWAKVAEAKFHKLRQDSIASPAHELS